jgi:hypothetical protein
VAAIIALVVAAALFLTLAPVYRVTNTPTCVPEGGDPQTCLPLFPPSAHYRSVSCAVSSIGVAYLPTNYSYLGSPSEYKLGCHS